MKTLFTLTIFYLIGLSALAQNGQFVETNGVKIYYEIHGEGDPLLLVHGNAMSHEMWNPFIAELSKHYKVIAPDLRGHGRSTNPANIFTIKESAKDMYGLMDALKIDKFMAMGHSGGGMTLTHMATMDTSRITKLVLMGTTPYIPMATRKAMLEAPPLHKTTDQAFKNYLLYLHPGGEEQLENIYNAGRKSFEQYDDVSFTPPYLNTIKSETLIIHGDRDEYFPIELPLQLYESIPNAYLWIVPNTNHFTIVHNGMRSIWSDMYVTTVKLFLDGNWDVSQEKKM